MFGKIGSISLIFALLVIGIRADCSGSVQGPIPYTVSYTKTGDSSSTSFIVQVCSTGCTDASSQTCQPLRSISFGTKSLAVTDGSTDDCGASVSGSVLGTLTTDSPANPGCASFYLEGSQPNMELSQACPDGCAVKFSFANGASAGMAIDQPVSPSANPSPESSPEPVPMPNPEPIPSPESSPSASPLPVRPSVYGSRRRSLSQYAGRRLSQYGSRRLSQYMGRRLSQYGR